MKSLFGMALVLCLVLGGSALAQTIDQIQYYDPADGTPLPGQDPDNFVGDLMGAQVTVTGVIVEYRQ
jgi:hypothetical protein